MVHAQTLLPKLSELLPGRVNDTKFRDAIGKQYPEINSPRDAAMMLLVVMASKQSDDLESTERLFVDCDRSEKPIRLQVPNGFDDGSGSAVGFFKESFKRSNIIDLIEHWIGNWQVLNGHLRALEEVTTPSSRSSIKVSISTSRNGAAAWVRVECADNRVWFSMPVLYATQDADHSDSEMIGEITDEMIIEVGKVVWP